MDNKTKRMILDDYEEVNMNILKILFHQDRPNLSVRSDHYVHPTIRGPQLPLNNPKGELH